MPSFCHSCPREEAREKTRLPGLTICVAYEAAATAFGSRFSRGWYEAHVMHSYPGNRFHRRAKTCLDCHLMMRAFLGWLRRKAGHCRMVAVPTAEQEDARRVTRERKGLVREQTKLINRLKAMFGVLGSGISSRILHLNALMGFSRQKAIRSRRTPLPKFDVPWIDWSLSGRRLRRSKIRAQRILPT